MKKCLDLSTMKYSCFILGLFLLLQACSTDFKVGAPYKEVTVAYGLLSKSDTANYIKITKGFFDETISNLVVATKLDSLYFKDLSVTIEELNNGSVVGTFTLPLVDVIQEGYIKQPGTFVDSPNYAYKFKHNLDPARTYRLKIKNNITGKEVEAETPIISDLSNQFSITNPFTAFDKLNFSDPIQSYTFSWTSPANAVFFDVVLRFYYQEKNTNTLVVEYKYKDLPLLKNVLANGGNTSAQMKNIDFFRILNSELKQPASYISRYVDTPDLMIMGGGDVLKTYIDVNGAQGGITYDQIKPNYTNFKGENILGLFSTRVTKYLRQIAFTPSTVDSIINGSYTKNLNFVGTSSQ